MNFSKYSLLALAIAAAAGTMTGEAQAATQTGCVVTALGYDNSPRLGVWCSGVTSGFYAHGTAWGSTCGAVSLDTLKVWQSLLQSAELSGRKVNIDYANNTTCHPGTTDRAITSVQLQRN